MLIGFGAQTFDLHQFFSAFDRADTVTVIDNIVGNGFVNPGYVFEQRYRSPVDVNPDVINRIFNGCFQNPFQFFLIDIMLILTNADMFGIDFDQFRQGILKPAANGNGPPDRNIDIRVFFGSQFRGRINRCSGFIDDDILDRHLGFFDRFGHKLFRFPGSSTVTDGNNIDLMAFNQFDQLFFCFFNLTFAKGGVDSGIIQHLADLIENGNLAAGSKGWVKAHRDLFFKRWLEQQFFQVEGKHLDGPFFRPFF